MLPRIEVDFEVITGETHWYHIPTDIDKNRGILEGMEAGQRVILFAENDLQTEGDLEFDESTQRWYGIPDWKTLRYHLVERIPNDPAMKGKLLRITVDFNTIMTDPRQRVWIREQDGLTHGMRVLLIDDFEVEGVIVFDDKYQSWYGLPDLSTVHYYDDNS